MTVVTAGRTLWLLSDGWTAGRILWLLSDGSLTPSICEEAGGGDCCSGSDRRTYYYPWFISYMGAAIFAGPTYELFRGGG